MRKRTAFCPKFQTEYPWLPGAPGQGIIQRCPYCEEIHKLTRHNAQDSAPAVSGIKEENSGRLKPIGLWLPLGSALRSLYSGVLTCISATFLRNKLMRQSK